MVHLDEVIVRLVANGCDINESSTLSTPLHRAIWGDHLLAFVIARDLWTGTIPMARCQSCARSIRLLLQLDSEVHKDFHRGKRFGGSQDVTTLYLASCAFVTKDILNAGAKLDAATVDDISKDLDIDLFLKVKHFQNIQLEDIADPDRASVAQLLLRIDHDNGHSAISPLTSSLPMKLGVSDPSFESSLRSACNRVEVELFQWLFNSAHLDMSYPVSSDLADGSTIPLLHYACSQWSS